MNRCPECESDDKFYHCYHECRNSDHIVTCLGCKTPYVVTENLKDYLTRTGDDLHDKLQRRRRRRHEGT